MKRALVLIVALLMVASLVGPAMAAPKGPDSVTIHRDEYGVPHLYAGSLESLFYGMGYVAADDRLWQAEILRRSATGTLAELFGPAVLAGDIDARRMFGPVERRTAAFEAASEDLKTMLTAYADGINARIAEGNLPLQYGFVGPPRPWTVDDSVAVFFLLGSQFGWFGSEELANAATYSALIAALGPADAATVFGDLFWLDDPDASTTVPADGAIGQKGRRAGGPPDGLPSSAAAAQLPGAAWDNAGLPGDGWASNALVISPHLSADGAALLLGGPQMGYGTPQINHEIGLHGAGFDVTGMTIAGFPLVPIGVGNGYAWTLTSGGSDNSDIYVEVLNPADPTQYLFNGEWLDLECRDENIGVAFAGVHTETLCTSVHGPILGSDGATALSFKNVTYGKELQSLEAWASLGKANNINEFASSLADVAYNFNVLYADRTGNIAYWHIGHIPIRAEGANRFLPLPGTGEAEWQGILPFSENPHARNPEQGFLTSWNNKPAPGWENSTGDFWMWGAAHRVNTFMAELKALTPRSATVETVEAINRTGGWTTDTPTGQASSVFVTSYLDEMLAHVDTSADPRLADVVDALAAWDHLQVDLDMDGFYDDPYGAVFNAWWFALAEGVFDEVWGISNRFIIGNLIDRMFKGPDAGLPLAYDYLEGATPTEAVTDALVAALDALTVDYGTADMSAWMQPISFINWAPLPLTPPVSSTIWMNRGTYNQIVHLRGNVTAQNVISPGQSGDPTSPHFADQLELYATWTYKPMRLSKADLKGFIESTTVLRVP